MATSNHISSAARFTWMTFITLCTASVQAQDLDTLFLSTGKYVTAKITEIGIDEIKYTDPGSEVKIVMVIDKADVLRIHYADGRREVIKQDERLVAFGPKVLAKDQVVKIAFLSPVAGHFTMGYERVIRPWMNLDASVGIIGVGAKNDDEEHSGFLVKAGVKFISRPDFHTRGTRRSHPLHGSYVKPEIIFNRFITEGVASGYDWFWGSDPNAGKTYRETCTNLAVNIVLGKQRFLGNGVTLDTFVGVGFGFQEWSASGADSNLSSTDHKGYTFSHVYGGPKLPIAISAGMTLGVAF